MRAFGSNPPGVYLLSVTEMWERFSYYALAGLLTLFLSAPAGEGGFGWRADQAVQIFGLVSGFAFAAPALGGWLVSRWVGEQRAITVGGFAIACGQVVLGHVAMHGPEAPVAVALFWLSLALIVLGTALFKPAVSAAVGLLYAPQDVRRKSGYAIFMTGVWAGSFFSNLVAGSIGEALGWHWGFFTAGGGMMFGVVLFVLLRKRWLSGLSERTVSVGSDADAPAWFLSISTGVFIIATPMFEAFWGRAAAKGKPAPDVCASLVIGLGLLAAGYAVFTMGFASGAGAAVPMLWFVAGYVLFGLADVFIWPPQIALASHLAPRHLASIIIGFWYVSIGVGSYISGLIGAALMLIDPAKGLAIVAACVAAAAIVARLAGPRILRLVNEGTSN
jgi:proton-dependent oligopeptide transporter, POT family